MDDTWTAGTLDWQDHADIQRDREFSVMFPQGFRRPRSSMMVVYRRRLALLICFIFKWPGNRVGLTAAG
jgi:hypothetical protein